MPLFLSEEEFRLCAHDAWLVAERADALILDLRRQLDAVRAEADAEAEKAGELEGVIKALETHLKQIENYYKEKLEKEVSLRKDYEKRQEANSVSARNVELIHLLIEYQKRVRESSDALNAVEENSRNLSMEISILKHEKEILSNSEKRAFAEVCSLSERVQRLQSSLDTIQCTEEIQETARAADKRNLEEHLYRVERDWADAKRELLEERAHVCALSQDKDIALNKSMAQVEELSKELHDARCAVASAEARAADAEAIQGLHEAEDVKKLKEEAEANKNYMLQYKEIAQTNENALKHIECVHEVYKAEAERLKKALEAKVLSLEKKISEKEKALSSTLAEKSSLNEEITEKLAQIGYLEVQVSSLSDDLEKEHNRWQTAQNNYERQVILQSETIQELTNTSKELSRLQEEVSKLQEFLEAQKTENDLLKSSGENEKLVLQELKDEAERKYNDLNEQNKILHNHLESLHVRLADSDAQTVLNYLRRSKEIAETEVSLLKQENLHLQSQIDALKASETAQREDSRAAAPSSNPPSSRKHAAPSSASDEVLKRPRHR